ncbi:unnamed protein product [Leptosia nina]|uniref:Uncharacterized protein n=1 Tax=Leptosia nina TaxID=320188 RepID=A0AAV1IXJ5_9NEOP
MRARRTSPALLAPEDAGPRSGRDVGLERGRSRPSSAEAILRGAHYNINECSLAAAGINKIASNETQYRLCNTNAGLPPQMIECGDSVGESLHRFPASTRITTIFDLDSFAMPGSLIDEVLSVRQFKYSTVEGYFYLISIVKS